MRFQLVSILALLASTSVEAAKFTRREAGSVANQAGSVGVPAPRELSHNTPRRRRSRHGKRRQCKVRAPASSTAAAADSSVSPSASGPYPNLAATGSASSEGPSASSSASETDSEASAPPSSSESSSTSSSQAPPAPSEVAPSSGGVNIGTKLIASGVTKIQGSLGPDQISLGNAIKTFSTGSGNGNGLLNLGNVERASFEQMTNNGNNPGLKNAYGQVKDNGDGSLTFTYKKGQVNDHDSWFWYTTEDPGATGMDLASAKTAAFTYTVTFENGFDFKLGGKLPGWYGGDNAEDAKACTGHAGSSSCFSSRLMWRDGGIGELYNYMWADNGQTQDYCDVEKANTWRIGNNQIVCNGGSGDSVGRGSFKFEAGKPVTITNTITLNTMNGNTPNHDGSQSLVVDGVKVVEANSLVLRHHEAGRIRGLFFSTFFGGSGSSWACPKEQSATFSDITVSVIESL